MQIILLTNGKRKTLSFSIADSKTIMTLTCGVVFILAGYFLFFNDLSAKETQSDYVVSELMEQRTELERVREKTQNTLDSIAIRVGQMQAQLMRLNAVGNQLANKAKLNSLEFAFEQPAAIGGAETMTQTNSFSESQLLHDIQSLDEQFSLREKQFKLLDYFSANKRLSKEVRPAGLPVAKGWLSSNYGYRADPFTGKKSFHHGVDIAGKSGTNVLAAASGLVTWVGEKNGYGYLVEIDHGFGYVTRYGHNKKLLVKTGDLVKQNDVIAKMGSTGRSTGPHVHFEVLRNGRDVNPRKYLYSSR